MRITVDIPEAVNGIFEIKKVTSDSIVEKEEPFDTYTVLYMNGIEIMQDTTHEYREHQDLWDNATGDVLIGGLGIGFVNQKLIDNPNVTSVTILEKNQEVIDLVWEHCPKDETFTLIHADIETWEPTQNFDSMWIDTWLMPDNPNQHEYNQKLIDKYEPYCNWIGVWNSLPIN
tara:strand:- start:103 stop:621 length:519 start_codon:yes stop_codon:yes gene_type:complete